MSPRYLTVSIVSEIHKCVINLEKTYRMSLLSCLDLLTCSFLIMQIDFMKSKPPVSYNGRKVSGLSRLVASYISWASFVCGYYFSVNFELNEWYSPLPAFFLYMFFLLDLLTSSCWMVQLELQFEDRAMQFTVAPVHASIIMQFQDQTRYT